MSIMAEKDPSISCASFPYFFKCGAERLPLDFREVEAVVQGCGPACGETAGKHGEEGYAELETRDNVLHRIGSVVWNCDGEFSFKIGV